MKIKENAWQENKNKVITYLKKETSKFDAVILIDYGHGFIDKEIYNVLKQKAKFSGDNVPYDKTKNSNSLVTVRGVL